MTDKVLLSIMIVIFIVVLVDTPVFLSTLVLALRLQSPKCVLRVNRGRQVGVEVVGFVVNG